MKSISAFVIISIMLIVLAFSQTVYKTGDIRLSPRLLNYQGYLTDTQGNPLNDTFDFIFRIYDAASAGSQLWTETQIEVPIMKGIFNVLLGSAAPIPDSVFTKGANRWLELRFNSQTLAPRTQIVSAPYAYTATYSDTAQYARAAPSVPDNDWTFRVTDTADTTLQMGGRWGLVRPGNTMYGNADSTHVNFGVACTTGVTGMNNRYAAVSGGLFNAAGGVAANVGGGVNNRATGDAAVVNGGQANTASGYLSGAVAGSNNVAGGDRAFVGGGISNAASGNSSAVAGGSLNTASGQWSVVGGGQSNSAGVLLSTVAGGQYDTVKAYFGGILSGYSNLAGDALDDSASVIAGGYNNKVWAKFASVLGGRNNRAGGIYSSVGGGINNIADSAYTIISGGSFNTAGNIYATIGGGIQNIASGTYATVDGGQSNTASGANSTVGGGQSNNANNYYATIGGGGNNIAGNYSTVGGGWQNTALSVSTVAGGSNDSAVGTYCMIGGGYHNVTVADYAVIGGGGDNRATGTASFIGSGTNNIAGGYCSAIPGGYFNLVNGSYSFAAGCRAKAYNQGCFVWGDATDADISASVDNRWVARCSGGVYFYTNSGLTSGVYVTAGGNSWSSVCDKNMKENFRPVDGNEILDKLAQMEITTWNYKSQDPSVRHIGPMAQDFAEFGVGEDDKHITTIDADGIALAAIQELIKQNKAQQVRMDGQQKKIEELEKKLSAIQ